MRRFGLAALLLAAGCASSPVPRPPALKLDRQIDRSPRSFELLFREKKGGTGRARFSQEDGSSSYSLTVSPSSGTDCRPGADWNEWMPQLSTVGVASFPRRGEEIFAAGSEGGTGRHDNNLLLIDPAACAVVGLTISVDHDATRPITAQAGLGGYDSDDRREETAFLDRVKRDYEFLGVSDVESRPKDPRFAYYFWAKDNGGLRDGRMRVRRYAGKPFEPSSSEAEVLVGSVTYIAQFKAGVVAYDAAADEHYVLFHPRDMYAWPTALALEGDVLVIGTRGEGAAAVNLRNFRLKRFPLDGPAGVVRELKIEGARALVNGSTPLDLKGF